jgi:hypothetical protein
VNTGFALSGLGTVVRCGRQSGVYHNIQNISTADGAIAVKMQNELPKRIKKRMV